MQYANNPVKVNIEHFKQIISSFKILRKKNFFRYKGFVRDCPNGMLTEAVSSILIKFIEFSGELDLDCIA